MIRHQKHSEEKGYGWHRESTWSFNQPVELKPLRFLPATRPPRQWNGYTVPAVPKRKHAVDQYELQIQRFKTIQLGCGWFSNRLHASPRARGLCSEAIFYKTYRNQNKALGAHSTCRFRNQSPITYEHAPDSFSKKNFFVWTATFSRITPFALGLIIVFFPFCLTAQDLDPGPTLRVEAKCFNGLTNLIRILQILLLQSCYLRTPLIECQQYAFCLATS